ncbi:MAG: hypothetical protein ACK5YQ_13725 [Betaproteobacteria bacterium]
MASQPVQRGALMLALLVMAGLLAVLFTAGLLTSRVTGTDTASRDRTTREALVQAKAALLAYAVTYAENHDPSKDLPGFLPCPDTSADTRDGAADSPCRGRNVNALGRLPWYTLDLPALRDASGECLWYAVAGRYKASALKTNDFIAATDQTTQHGLFNWDTPGQLDVFGPDGTSRLTADNGYDRAVAIVFAPGGALGSQNRARVNGTSDCGGNYTASNYLDTRAGIDNALIAATAPDAGANSSFVQGPAVPEFNDQLIVITARELWSAIWRSRFFQARAADLTRKVAECVARYPSDPADERLPWATPITADIVNSDSQQEADNSFLGRVPFKTPVSNGVTGNATLRLLGTSIVGGRCATWTAQTNIWYANFKDQLFYALSDAFRPAGGAGGRSCGANDCITVNGVPLAAGVMLAGPPFAGQSRRPGTAEVQDVANYLEEPNRTQASIVGNGAFASFGPAPFNDSIVCGIDASLTVPVTAACP